VEVDQEIGMKDHTHFQSFKHGTSRLAAVVACAALALSLPLAAYAQGGFNGPGRYQITNVKSGKVLDLDRNDQRSVIQFSSRGTDNQMWEIRPAGGNFYTLRSVMNGNALEAMGTRNSTPVQATPYHGRNSQQWLLETAPDGNLLLVSRLGKALDVPDGTGRDGAPIQIYDRNGDSNQQFTLRQIAGAQTAASTGRVRPAGRVAASPVSPAAAAPMAPGNRTELKPGWNMFSAAQDVELGQQASQEVAQQVLLLNNSRVDNYVNTLGQRLAAKAPGHQFPYQFRTVNDRGINAFALPGGQLYINRGVIEAADNESQLAGVMAHEIAHVALRHGTNQASKASMAQMPLAILGGLMGSNSTAAALAQLGAGFTLNSILLKYSRDAESQADLMATQILYDAGFDPRAMGQFFNKLEGGGGMAFFNSHPNPDRRVEKADEEAAKLGPVARSASTSSQEFTQIKRYVQSLPEPRPSQLQSQQQQQQNQTGQQSGTSGTTQLFENSILRVNYPGNWQAFGQGEALTIAPSNGMVKDANGNQALAYGVVVSMFEPYVGQSGQRLQGPGGAQRGQYTVESATDQLVQELRQSNRNMRVVRRHEQINVSGQSGLSTYLSNDSPIQNGGRETNWLVTVPRSEGLLFFVFTAPEREFHGFENAFQQMLYSVRLK
jgi:beta-barrel assembly-enhancing protease